MSLFEEKKKQRKPRAKPDPNAAKLTPEATQYLKDWMMSPAHIDSPYPTEDDKEELMMATGLSKKQITCWFSNNRKRYWKPKMDSMGREANLLGNTLSEHTVAYLKNWMLCPEHIQNPYPTPTEKQNIIDDTGITKQQLICWFSNNRKRIWKVKLDELKMLYGVSQEENLSDEHWEMYQSEWLSNVASTSFEGMSAHPAPAPPAAAHPSGSLLEPDLHAPIPPPDLHGTDDIHAPVAPPALDDIDYAAITAAEVVESMSQDIEETGGSNKRQKTSTDDGKELSIAV